MSDKNTISFKELMEDVEAGYEPVKTVHLFGRDIEVKRHLGVSETLEFVSDVINLCYVSIPDESGEEVATVYTPELKDYAIAAMTIAYYTNIDLNDGDASKKKGRKKKATPEYTPYTFITHSKIVDAILNEIDLESYEKMLKAIDDKIKYMNDSGIIEMTREFKEFSNALEELGPAIRSLASINTDELAGILKQLSGIQIDNTIKELATKEMKSDSAEVIEFTQKEPGDNNGDS